MQKRAMHAAIPPLHFRKWLLKWQIRINTTQVFVDGKTFRNAFKIGRPKIREESILSMKIGTNAIDIKDCVTLVVIVQLF